MVESELQNERLREVLPDYRAIPERKLYAVFPTVDIYHLKRVY